MQKLVQRDKDARWTKKKDEKKRKLQVWRALAHLPRRLPKAAGTAVRRFLRAVRNFAFPNPAALCARRSPSRQALNVQVDGPPAVVRVRGWADVKTLAEREATRISFSGGLASTGRMAVRKLVEGVLSFIGAAIWWLVDRLWGDAIFAAIRPMIPNWAIDPPVAAWIEGTISYGPPLALVILGSYFFLSGRRQIQIQRAAQSELQPGKP